MLLMDMSELEAVERVRNMEEGDGIGKRQRGWVGEASARGKSGGEGLNVSAVMVGVSM